MKRANANLDGIYERDPATNAFIVATATERYTDIFNELDPAPFKKRDINHDLRVFLEDCSADIPLKYNVILQFNLLKDVPDPKKEERITSGLRNYFYLIINQLKREINRSYHKGTLYMGVSFFLLLVAYSLRTLSTNNAVFTTLVEGVNIGGWVFLWEAISTFAFKKRDVRNRKKHYARFTRAQIRFKYATAKLPSA
jgi:hypothetical protein